MEPVSKLVVITHPFYRDVLNSIALPRGKLAKADKSRLAELKRIIQKVKREPGTHVIVSYYGIPHHEVKKLLKAVPKSRLHVAEAADVDGLMNSSNFFSEDPSVVKRLSGMEFAGSVSIEGWGDHYDVCLPENLRGVADFVEGKARTAAGKKPEISRILLLSGDPAFPGVRRVVDGKPAGKDFEAHSRWSWRMIAKALGPHAEKASLAGSIEYKPISRLREASRRTRTFLSPKSSRRAKTRAA